jgi:D-alanyl-D-alanine carboxypeptidase/D-alanyl-D-alanine-endopeptidase (penicillin-binding protein 4)
MIRARAGCLMPGARCERVPGAWWVRRAWWVHRAWWVRTAVASLLLFCTTVPPAARGTDRAPGTHPAPGTRSHQAPSTRHQAPRARYQVLSQQLTRIFDAPILDHSYLAVVVRSMTTGETVLARNSGKLMMPASNMKVVTLAAAAERLGWGYRFETRFVSDGAVVDGRLGGDLVIVGSGDPSMNERHDRADKILEDVAWQLREAGIHAIEGRIVADDRLFSGAEIGGGWSWDYLHEWYAAPINALAFGENFVTVLVEPGLAVGEAAQVTVLPSTSDLETLNHALTAAAGTDPTVDLARERGSRTLDVVGTIPLGSQPVRRPAAVEDPGLCFARATRDALIRHGIDVRGDAMVTPSNPIEPARTPSNPLEPSRTIARVLSPPLWEIATVMMKASQNLYAEMLLRVIGGGTMEGGRRAVTDVMTSWKIEPQTFVIADGSGLSRYNYVTAEMLVTILEQMYRDPRHRERFMATLPIAGVDGTLERRMRGTKAQGNLRAKTGSIANARSLSGYVRTAGGDTLGFAILANNFTLRGAQIDEITDRAVDAMVRTR